MKKDYFEFEVGNKVLRLRIKARLAAQLAKLLKGSPLIVLMKLSEHADDAVALMENMPSLEQYAWILNAALQAYEHGYDMDKTYDVIDKFIEEGHSMMELINVVTNVLRVSGYMPEQEEEQVEEQPEE